MDDVLGPHEKVCPNCGAAPLVRGRIATITEQQAKAMDVDAAGEDVQKWNAMATTYDGVMCRNCDWSGFAESGDPGISAGAFGHRLRFNSYKCSDCDVIFDQLQELADHMRDVHGEG